VRLQGLNKDRVDSIVGGFLVVQTTLEHVGAKKIQVSGQGLREGIALATLGQSPPPAPAVRQASVDALMRRFATCNSGVAQRRARIARRFARHPVGDAPEEIEEVLHHACLLLDIGRSVDYYDRHRNAAVILAGADLQGFSQRGISLAFAVFMHADNAANRLRVLRPDLKEKDAPMIERAATAAALGRRGGATQLTGTAGAGALSRDGDALVLRSEMLAGWRPRSSRRPFPARFRSGASSPGLRAEGLLVGGAQQASGWRATRASAAPGPGRGSKRRQTAPPFSQSQQTVAPRSEHRGRRQLVETGRMADRASRSMPLVARDRAQHPHRVELFFDQRARSPAPASRLPRAIARRCARPAPTTAPHHFRSRRQPCQAARRPNENDEFPEGFNGRARSSGHFSASRSCASAWRTRKTSTLQLPSKLRSVHWICEQPVHRGRHAASRRYCTPCGIGAGSRSPPRRVARKKSPRLRKLQSWAGYEPPRPGRVQPLGTGVESPAAGGAGAASFSGTSSMLPSSS
jgi:hypothetical protein